MESLQLFNFEGQDVRVLVGEDGEPRWVLADVATILEYGRARDAAKYLDDDEKGAMICRSPGGPQEMTVVTEAGLYSLILRSRKPEAKRFKRWLTHEVIPAIRKTGRYAVRPEPGPALPPAPRTYAEALRALADKVDEAEAHKARADALEPPARAWEAMADTGQDFAVADAAKILSRDEAIDIGEGRLFTYLVETGVAFVETEGARKNRRAYKPYQQHVDAGRFVLKLGKRWKHPGTGEWRPALPQLRITVKGLEFLHKKLGGVGALQLDDPEPSANGGPLGIAS